MSDIDANIAGHIAALGIHGFKVYRENAVISRDHHDHEIARLTKANAELREALNGVMEDGHYEDCSIQYTGECTPKCKRIRKALANNSEGE